MFIHGSAAGGTSVAADNARRCRTTDPSQDKGLRKRIAQRDSTHLVRGRGLSVSVGISN